MSVEEAKSPLLAEFKKACREQFAFLLSAGFTEVSPLRDGPQNPYEVHFRKGGWRVVVGGYSYGFSAAVDIRSPDGRQAWFGFAVPKEQRLGVREQYGRGQLGDIECQAALFREFGASFIQGEWGGFEDLCRLQEAYRVANEGAWQAYELTRSMERAIVKANEAFKAGNYSEVISQLAPFEASLPSSQKMKLLLAKKRS